MLLFFAAASCAFASDHEPREERVLERVFLDPDWREDEIEFPALPRPSDLVRFEPNEPGSPHEYFLDRRSYSIGGDGVARFTVVVRSRSGVDNLFYEGVRCATGEHRSYGFGLPEGGGFRARRGGGWRAVSRHGPPDHRRVLVRELVCDETASPVPWRTLARRLAARLPG